MLTSPAFYHAAVLAVVGLMELRLRSALGRVAVAGVQGERQGSAAAPPAGPEPAPPAAQPAPAGVQPVDTASPDQSPAGESRPTAVAPAGREALRPQVFMAPAEQMADFMRWVIQDGFCGEHASDDWVKYYRDWAAACRMAAMTDAEFLRRLAKVESVTKARPRLMGRDGRVLKTAGGTDIRVTTYHFPLPAAVAAAATTGAAPARRKPTKSAERFALEQQRRAA